jgi:CRP/FNR family transcriptional regulator, cyclic AMP receptor protein
MPFPLIALQAFELLRGLPPEQLAMAGQQMHESTFARRAIVFKKDEPSPALGFLIEGRLQAVDFTVDGREVGLYFVEPGDYFGELSIIDGERMSEFVIAVARSRVAFLPRDTARTLMFSMPQIAERVTTRLARRLRGVSTQRRLLGLASPFQRLCAQLLQLLETSGGGTITITSPPTHQEIAIMINASRETVTRAFQLLQSQRILRRDGNSLRVEDPGQLRAIAEGRREAPKA